MTHSAVILLALLWTGTILADRVELKTGEVFFGKILRADGREVTVRLSSGGIIAFRRNQVAYFRKSFVESKDWNPVIDGEGKSEPDVSVAITLPTEPRDAPPATPDTAISLSTPQSLDPSLVHSVITDSTNGFRLAPPKGFLTWQKEDDSAALGYYYDPVTQANLDIVSLRYSGASIEDIKKRTTRAYSLQVANLKVVRDQPVRDVSYDGWIYEIKSEPGGVEVHQIQLFAMSQGRVILLTYSCPESHFSDYRLAFAESLRSFSFIGADTGARQAGIPVIPLPDAPRKSLEVLPPQGDSSLLQLLRGDGG